MDTTAYTVTALLAGGMGAGFLVSDWRQTNNRLFFGVLVSLALSFELNARLQTYPSVDALPAWMRLTSIPIALTLIFGCEWVLRIRQTIPAADLNTRFGDTTLRVGQWAALAFGAMSLWLWRERSEWIMFELGQPGALRDPAIIILSVPLIGSILCLLQPILLTLNRKPDWPEKVRLLSFAASLPFFGLGFLLPPEIAVYGLATGLVILLVGAVEYSLVQGQRGQFMARFLAPQVADLVNRQGLQQTIRDQSLEISAVYCDIRGFTAYAERRDPAEVIGLLRDYYDAIGRAAEEVGGTIKDYAGDGVLILIGAPLACTDYAARAVRLAQMLQERAGAVVARQHKDGQPLGLGIGVATGQCAVGLAGGSRLEYVAVGSTVNLSARLCQVAARGQVLIDERTRALLDRSQPCTRSDAELKGFSGRVEHYALN